ncbi:MAG TPA: NAD(P)-dependent oxidoreductase, partial [Bryobacteraceae bacterium]
MPNPLAADLEHVLAHTSGVWNEFAGARLFLTGGTGFFGCWLLESFAWACDHAGLDAEILVLTRSPEKFRAKAPHLAVHRGIGILEGDVRAFQFPQGRFTHVIHGATDASAQLIREQPLLMLDTIVEGTRRTLDFAVTAGARRFLLLSSGAVYAQPDPADPGTVYAEGKRVAELLCSLYSRQYPVECLTARCFAFVGPYLPLDAHYAIG